MWEHPDIPLTTHIVGKLLKQHPLLLLCGLPCRSPPWRKEVRACHPLSACIGLHLHIGRKNMAFCIFTIHTLSPCFCRKEEVPHTPRLSLSKGSICSRRTAVSKLQKRRRRKGSSFRLVVVHSSWPGSGWSREVEEEEEEKNKWSPSLTPHPRKRACVFASLPRQPRQWQAFLHFFLPASGPDTWVMPLLNPGGRKEGHTSYLPKEKDCLQHAPPPPHRLPYSCTLQKNKNKANRGSACACHCTLSLSPWQDGAHGLCVGSPAATNILRIQLGREEGLGANYVSVLCHHFLPVCLGLGCGHEAAGTISNNTSPSGAAWQKSPSTIVLPSLSRQTASDLPQWSSTGMAKLPLPASHKTKHGRLVVIIPVFPSERNILPTGDTWGGTPHYVPPWTFVALDWEAGKGMAPKVVCLPSLSPPLSMPVCHLPPCSIKPVAVEPLAAVFSHPPCMHGCACHASLLHPNLPTPCLPALQAGSHFPSSMGASSKQPPTSPADCLQTPLTSFLSSFTPSFPLLFFTHCVLQNTLLSQAVLPFLPAWQVKRNGEGQEQDGG